MVYGFNDMKKLTYLYELPNDTWIDVSELNWIDEGGEKINLIFFECIIEGNAIILHNKRVYYLPSCIAVPYDKNG